MKCLSQQQLIAYMHDKLPTTKREQLEKHLDHCSDCQKQLEQFVDELVSFGDDGWTDDSFSETFEQDIINKIHPYPVSVLKQSVAHKIPHKMNWKKRSIDIMKKMTITVAGLALVVSLGTLVSPTFATYVNGLYNGKTDIGLHVISTKNSLFSDYKNADEGLIHAIQKGYSKRLDLSVTDQGLTFEVKEVLADPLRITMILGVKDSKGNRIDLSELYDEEEISLKDKKGNVLKPNQDLANNPLYEKESDFWAHDIHGDYIVLERALFDFYGEEKALPDEMNVELNVKKLGETNGNWKIQVPIEMKKAKEATKTKKINQEYTSPQGLKISLNEVVFAPSGTQLIMDTTAKGEDKEFTYELADEQGKSIAAWESPNFRGAPPVDEPLYYKNGSSNKNVIDSLTESISLAEGSDRWFHTFTPTSEKMTFKLTSLIIGEAVNFQAKLNIEKLQKEPIKVEGQGNLFRFTKFNQNEKAAKGGSSIDFEAVFPKDFINVSGWKLKDETGKRIIGVFPSGKTTITPEGNVQLQGKLIFDNGGKLPKELTVTYDKVLKQNHDVQWEVPIHLEKK
ncbi:DUF4179 domain-containing protein [Brevibacillus laterosporus]|uniref:DUF4179 domain-containing protein n=1 Tax=Brevibacillus laterosporus TaxID=1465 RepID=UPI000CE54D7D|nr:DUF4179 domain-containing protein [Brevibacillus laterosporus]MED1663885.1 DUF4179 domain-containing protein [Brevibacillus laterosporus]MED1669315.1 DUF4179 domain-containing protein [Brevibacillus laterosporus]MED1719525.1 DUF4179 domain-containing protein [Brevibacillus laterosporus]PPA88704.1 hypothetical protein C4A76_07130 [Brevibacillus laterosporus]